MSVTGLSNSDLWLFWLLSDCSIIPCSWFWGLISSSRAVQRNLTPVDKQITPSEKTWKQDFHHDDNCCFSITGTLGKARLWFSPRRARRRFGKLEDGGGLSVSWWTVYILSLSFTSIATKITVYEACLPVSKTMFDHLHMATHVYTDLLFTAMGHDCAAIIKFANDHGNDEVVYRWEVHQLTDRYRVSKCGQNKSTTLPSSEYQWLLSRNCPEHRIPCRSHSGEPYMDP